LYPSACFIPPGLLHKAFCENLAGAHCDGRWRGQRRRGRAESAAGEPSLAAFSTCP